MIKDNFETMNNNNMAFLEGEPSLFIIQTPFQAMCAINAIRQLKIDDYELQLHLHRATENRNKQTVELVERYGLTYKVVKTVPIGFFKLIEIFYKRNGRFNRVFLGTHLYHDGYYYALKVLRERGNLVLLDDGTATLTLLKGDYKVTGKSAVYMSVYKAVAKLCKIKINNLFTVYKGVDHSIWNIAYNDISKLRQNVLPTTDRVVFFIGVCNSDYVERWGVPESDFKKMLSDILKRVKMSNPSDKIIYIPHGRDKSMFTKTICEEIEIEYKPSDVNVENYILSLNITPHIIYGFTSSALYNLKMIFPESNVLNIVTSLLSNVNHCISNVSAYYERQGIPTITV